MLRVTIHDSRTERRVLLEGKLAGPCVSEFESIWKQARGACQACSFVIDLSEATVIDASGKVVLMAMISEGARLTGKGVYTECLVNDLTQKAQQHGRDAAAPSIRGPTVDFGLRRNVYLSEYSRERGTRSKW